MQFHILSFEGVDAYARAGGLATRIDGLTEALATAGIETHLWFVGDPGLAAYERRGSLHLHRWCQGISKHRPGGVYDGDHEKAADYGATLPTHLVQEFLLPHLKTGGQAVVMAEEWQTVDAVLHLDSLLGKHGARNNVSVFWNANNAFGFEGIDWQRLAGAATITAVSRYMRHRMNDFGVDAIVIPNGLSPDAYESPDKPGVQALRQATRGRVTLAKMARWDPDKCWLGTVDMVAELKRRGWRPLLVARGGSEPHGREVIAAIQNAGLRLAERSILEPGPVGLVDALQDIDDIDVVSLTSHVDPQARRVMFRAVDAVLANSVVEPFGLVGLETMAVGGIACTGCTGEDYAISGRNALVLQTSDPKEFMSLYRRLRDEPTELAAMRRAGKTTAHQYAWPDIIRRNLLPRIALAWSSKEPASIGARLQKSLRPQTSRRIPSASRPSTGSSPSVSESAAPVAARSAGSA